MNQPQFGQEDMRMKMSFPVYASLRRLIMSGIRHIGVAVASTARGFPAVNKRGSSFGVQAYLSERTPLRIADPYPLRLSS